MRRFIVLLITAFVISGCSMIGSASSVALDVDHRGDGVPLSQEEIKTLKDKTNWKVSPTFLSGNRTLTGIKNKVAYFKMHGSQVWVAGIGMKAPWAFWGDYEKLKNRGFSVVAIHKETGVVEQVLTKGTGSDEKVWTYNEGIMGPNFGADAHIPAGMVFSKPGLWCLNAFLDEELIGQIVVKVE